MTAGCWGSASRPGSPGGGRRSSRRRRRGCSVRRATSSHMDAGRVLREARLKAGLTQRELSMRAGIAQPAIARIESGKVTPRVDTLDRLLRACGWALESTRRLGEGLDRTGIHELLSIAPEE